MALVVKNLAANAGDTGSVPRRRGDNPLQYSYLRNPRAGELAGYGP